MAATFAVLTGDLIGSTKAGEDAVGTAFTTLSESSLEIGRWTGADTRLTRSRGDIWQMVLVRPEYWLRASLYLVMRLRAKETIATRIGVGIGPIKSFGTSDLSDALGPAFERAGLALDTLPKRSRLALNYGGTGWQHLSVSFIDRISQKWTQSQAEAGVRALVPGNPTQTAIAAELGVSQQAIGQRLAGMEMDLIEAALSLAEA
ncbi:MAG: hypothetical protein EBT13_04105 [Rhodobacteraceae bacterium]|nr:hypothetical protein [Paracoccaceae bacterium]